MREYNNTQKTSSKESTKLRQKIAELQKANQALKEELTERKKIEKELRESEEMHKTMLENSFDSVVMLDLDTKTIAVSKGTCELLGLESADEIIGRKGFESIAPEDQEKAEVIYQKILAVGFVKNMEIKLLKKDGTPIIVESNVTLIKDANGKPKGLTSCTRDITERKKAEEALRESEEMYRTLVKTSPDPIAVGELTEGKMIEMSDKTPELFGLDSVDQLLGRSGIEFMIPEDQERAKIVLQKVFNGEPLRNVEF